MPLRPLVLIPAVLLTLGFFAANSVLARVALAGNTIDAGMFTLVRLTSGALLLALLTLARNRHRNLSRSGSWSGALALVGYAAGFSFAYLRLETGTGALVLFGAVQITMIGCSLWAGARPSPLELAGMALAFGGLLAFLLPGATFTDPVGLLWMALAGVCWGIYSLLGRSSSAPVLTTAGNFLRSVVVMALLLPLLWHGLHATSQGLLLAAGSGALASALGYCLWYLVLPSLSTLRASLLQLSVPILAALGGILFLGERISMQLVLCGSLVLCGISLAVLGRDRQTRLTIRPMQSGS